MRQAAESVSSDMRNLVSVNVGNGESAAYHVFYFWRTLRLLASQYVPQFSRLIHHNMREIAVLKAMVYRTAAEKANHYRQRFFGRAVRDCKHVLMVIRDEANPSAVSEQFELFSQLVASIAPGLDVNATSSASILNAELVQYQAFMATNKGPPADRIAKLRSFVAKAKTLTSAKDAVIGAADADTVVGSAAVKIMLDEQFRSALTKLKAVMNSDDPEFMKAFQIMFSSGSKPIYMFALKKLTRVGNLEGLADVTPVLSKFNSYLFMSAAAKSDGTIPDLAQGGEFDPVVVEKLRSGKFDQIDWENDVVGKVHATLHGGWTPIAPSEM